MRLRILLGLLSAGSLLSASPVRAQTAPPSPADAQPEAAQPDDGQPDDGPPDDGQPDDARTPAPLSDVADGATPGSHDDEPAAPTVLAKPVLVSPTPAARGQEPGPKPESGPGFGAAGDDWTAGAAEDDAGVSEDAYRLQIYGFADANYLVPLWKDKSVLSAFLERQENGFFMGNINLYAVKPISQSIRSLLEVRFMFSPNGVTHNGGSTEGPIRTKYEDYNDFTNPRDWGGIQIQRAWVEKDVTDWMTLRAGYFLTPYGIWNVDHGSPTIIGVRRPFVVGQQLFPEFQMGLMAHGELPAGKLMVGYNAYVGNGRGPFTGQRDLDEEKSVGGRLTVSGRGQTRWTLGVSGLYDHYTDRDGIVINEDLESEPRLLAEADELGLGADLSVSVRNVVVRAEFVYNERVYDGARPMRSDTSLAPDYRRYGGYALVGYRFPSSNVMPYYLFEHYKWADDPNFDSVQPQSVGVNWRPNAALVVKSEFTYGPLDDRLPIDVDPIMSFLSQVAWAF